MANTKGKTKEEVQTQKSGPFDKFMKDLDKRIDQQASQQKQMKGAYQETPQEKYNKRYREHAHNRIVIGDKK